MTDLLPQLDRLLARLSDLRHLPVVWPPQTTDVPRMRSASRLAWTRHHTHSHAFREIMIAAAGRCGYGVEGMVYRAEPGTLFLFDVDCRHDLGYPPTPNTVRHLWMTLAPGQVLCRMVHVDANGFRMVSDTTRVLAQLDGEGALDALWDATDDRPAAVTALWSSIVNTVARYIMALAERPDKAQSVQQAAVRAIADRLMETGGRPADLATLARLAGYSPCHFHKLFTQQMQMTPGRYINRCRLKRTHLLLQRGYSRKAIAMELGFSSASSFARWYARQGRPFD